MDSNKELTIGDVSPFIVKIQLFAPAGCPAGHLDGLELPFWLFDTKALHKHVEDDGTVHVFELGDCYQYHYRETI